MPIGVVPLPSFSNFYLLLLHTAGQTGACCMPSHFKHYFFTKKKHNVTK